MRNQIITCAVGVGVLLLAGSAQADYRGLSAESIADTAHGTTVRLYVNLDAGDRLDAVYGSGDNPLVIGTTGSFYHHDLGGDTSASINPLLLGSYPSLEFDTWVTIGLGDMDDNALIQHGVDFSSFDNEVMTSNGSWFVTPDEMQGMEMGGRVLIGQFTIEGGGSIDDMYGNVNLQGKLADGTTWTSLDQWVPAPGALALLGLAGIAGRRRRRN